MDSCLLYKKHRFIRWSLALALGIVWLNTGHSAADDSLDSSQIARRLSHAFRTAAEKAMPSVVTIITKTAVEEGRELTREDFPFEFLAAASFLAELGRLRLNSARHNNVRLTFYDLHKIRITS